MPTFSLALRGISTGLRGLGMAETVTPIPGARPLAALSFLGAGIAEGLNYLLSGSSDAVEATSAPDSAASSNDD